MREKLARNLTQAIHDEALMSHLHFDVQNRSQLIHVGFATGTSEDAVIGKCVQFRLIPGQDLVSAAQACISGHNAIVFTGDGCSSTSVKVIGRESMLHRNARNAVVGVVINVVRFSKVCKNWAFRAGLQDKVAVRRRVTVAKWLHCKSMRKYLQ
jgi:hypothetical protein